MEITFDSLTQYSNECFYNNRYPQARPIKTMIEEIRKLIDVDTIRLAYPKNLFVDGKQVEIYLFDDKEHMFRVVCENEEVNIQVYLLKNVSRLESSSNYGEEPRLLTIEFLNGESFRFDSRTDTNSYHVQRFNDLINQSL